MLVTVPTFSRCAFGGFEACDRVRTCHANVRVSIYFTIQGPGSPRSFHCRHILVSCRALVRRLLSASHWIQAYFIDAELRGMAFATGNRSNFSALSKTASLRACTSLTRHTSQLVQDPQELGLCVEISPCIPAT